MEIPAVPPLDAAAQSAAVARADSLAVPLGGLGVLAELGCWLAAAQGVSPPRPPARVRALVVAADHGIAAAGVSRWTSTLPQSAAVTAGTAPAVVLATVGGASVRLLDVGLDHDSPDPAHVRRGSGRVDREDALIEGEAERAFAAGRALVDAEVDAGTDLVVPGSLGAGATTVAAVVVAALTGAEPVAVVGRGSGIDDQGWMRKAAAVRDALRRARPHTRDPFALLRAVGGTDLAALAGILVQASARRTPVLLDGLVAGAAALLADELAPGARDWWRVAQRSPEPAMALVCEHLELVPVVDLRVRAGDGTGALAVLPLLTMAARLLAETATLEPEPPADATNPADPAHTTALPVGASAAGAPVPDTAADAAPHADPPARSPALTADSSAPPVVGTATDATPDADSSASPVGMSATDATPTADPTASDATPTAAPTATDAPPTAGSSADTADDGPPGSDAATPTTTPPTAGATPTTDGTPARSPGQ